MGILQDAHFSCLLSAHVFAALSAFEDVADHVQPNTSVPQESVLQFDPFGA
jgi:hypothetical protein